MGVTSQSIQTIEGVLKAYPWIKSVIDLGAQNDYRDEVIRTNPVKYPYISEFWKSKGKDYASIDLSGENGSSKLDLSEPIKVESGFVGFRLMSDLVMDFGTSEHVKNYFEVNRNIHNLCKPEGIIIREVPLVGNWPEHGLHYVDETFFETLAIENKYEIIEMRREAAMGNEVNGWNIICVLQKKENNAFSDRFPVHVSFDDLIYERSQEWIYNPKK